MVQFVQFKKREKQPRRSFTFRLKITLLHGCFSRFLNCTIDTKSRNASHDVAVFDYDRMTMMTNDKCRNKNQDYDK